MKVLVSACLLGTRCKWNGRSNENQEIISLKENYELIPACAESLAGLPTPRIPSEIVDGKVINEIGLDLTSRFNFGAEHVLQIALKNDCKAAILYNGSPSCGSSLVYNGKFERTKIPGEGITTKLLRANGIIVYSETEIQKFLEDFPF